ncbi:MAG: transposase [Paludibacteraceae bacterium]|nr:transposase [Paludibacteraceae bacterium]
MTPRYNPMKHHRRSIRLRGYDYASANMYFITLCVKDFASIFGEIVNGEMILNDYGCIVRDCWENTTSIRPNVKIHDYVIMPNHFHAIVEIMERNKDIPLDTPIGKFTSPIHTLGSIVRGFKSAVSVAIGDSVWHRNYYEHIIRGYRDYNRISAYIKNNPRKWYMDKFRSSF